MQGKDIKVDVYEKMGHLASRKAEGVDSQGDAQWSLCVPKLFVPRFTADQRCGRSSSCSLALRYYHHSTQALDGGLIPTTKDGS